MIDVFIILQIPIQSSRRTAFNLACAISEQNKKITSNRTTIEMRPIWSLIGARERKRLCLKVNLSLRYQAQIQTQFQTRTQIRPNIGIWMRIPILMFEKALELNLSSNWNWRYTNITPLLPFLVSSISDWWLFFSSECKLLSLLEYKLTQIWVNWQAFLARQREGEREREDLIR